MTKNLLRFFACTSISDDRAEDLGTDLVWEEDSEVECYCRRHAVTVGILVVPFLCVVTLGFPIGTLVVLRRYKDRLNEEDIVATYGFLYRAYDKHYWEVVIMMRKAVIATVAVFAYVLGENLQGLMCILVMVFALGLHLTFQPFTKDIPQLNYLETCSLSTTITVFVAGLMMNDDQTGSNARTFLSIAAILVMVTTFAMMIMGLLSASEEVLDMKLIETEAMEISRIIDARLSKKLEVLALYYWNKLKQIGERLHENMKNRAAGRQARHRRSPGNHRGPRARPPHTV